MATLTIRLADEKHERLRKLAERRKISMNKLIDELLHRRPHRARRRDPLPGTSRPGGSRKGTGAAGSPGSGG